jgi:putative methionine-R-sulfoxide reductase with GAF domain
MMQNFTLWLKKYRSELLLSIAIVFVCVLPILANTWLAYILGALVVITLLYFIAQLKKAAKIRMDRLLELDKGNRELLLNNTEPFNAERAVSSIADNLHFAINFVREIGKGNFEARIEGVTEENFNLNTNNLAGELINMKVQMKTSADEEKKRVWAAQGLANFGDLLRSANHDLSKLSQEVIVFVVKYLKANQGGIFVLNDEDENNKHLELKAAYAFERKKFLTKKVALGEGLVGQAFLERETIYLKKLPQNYVTITSGLGGANPHALILVPLKIEEAVLGILEIASFKDFEKHEIEFCEKIGESIASTISAAQVNERTRNLLEQSQQQSEEMRAQEEEMRQNMEEMQATQEEMGRKENDFLDRISELEKELATKHAIAESESAEHLQHTIKELETALHVKTTQYQQWQAQAADLNKVITKLQDELRTQPTLDATWSNIIQVEKDLATSAEAMQIAYKTITNK